MSAPQRLTGEPTAETVLAALDSAPNGTISDTRLIAPIVSTSAAASATVPAAGASSSSAAAAGVTATGAAGSEEVRPEDVPRPAAAPKPPLYKRRWFIITSIVGACLGIAILFILLYTVVHAIAQHIVNVSVLNVDRAAITNPTNTS